MGEDEEIAPSDNGAYGTKVSVGFSETRLGKGGTQSKKRREKFGAGAGRCRCSRSRRSRSRNSDRNGNGGEW